MAQPTEYEQVTYNAPDGAQFGKAATEKIAFYGTTPVDRYTLVGVASTYTPFNQSTGSASTWGFGSAAEVSSLVYQVSTITVALRRVGLIT